MIKMLKGIFKFMILASLLFALSGCYNKSAEDLYSLPQASEEYLQLQEKINMILASGAEYAAPVSGSNRQSVQLEDLDGDGADEAIAFFSESGDKPLNIYIFRSIDGTYEEAAVIQGEGTAIDSITYTDMDNDGIAEILVGWQMSSTLKMLGLYSIHDFQVAPLLSSDYTEYTTCDMDNDEDNDFVILRVSESDHTGELEMYSLTEDGEVVSKSAQLSKGIESVTRMRTSTLYDGYPAIYIESIFAGGSMITDIFVFKFAGLRNITADRISGISEDTVRLYSVYSSDINNDGILEVPFPRVLQAQSDTSYYVIDWYSYSSQRRIELVLTTYHNYSDGWYLILPDDWGDQITVRREDSVSGERALVFSLAAGEGEPVVDFLVIYTLSGENKEERAQLDGRFTILAEEDTIYAAEILNVEASLDLTISRPIISNNFKIIYSDWITGET